MVMIDRASDPVSIGRSAEVDIPASGAHSTADLYGRWYASCI